VLNELDLKIDRDGQRRTAYSLRHTYICFRLMEGADIYQIAKNCRTSVEMIEKHYASHRDVAKGPASGSNNSIICEALDSPKQLIDDTYNLTMSRA